MVIPRTSGCHRDLNYGYHALKPLENREGTCFQVHFFKVYVTLCLYQRLTLKLH